MWRLLFALRLMICMEELLSKAEVTKIFIVEKSAPVFNRKGYAGTSMSDIMSATGLTKGGIYGNFKSKDEIALAAYDHNVKNLYEIIVEVVKAQDNAVDKIRAILGYHKTLINDPSFRHGCPILNTAIEADDTHPQLKEKVLKTIDDWKAVIIKIIENGIKWKQFKGGLDAGKYANLFISMIEGSMMLSKVYSDQKYLSDCFIRIDEVIEKELKA